MHPATWSRRATEHFTLLDVARDPSCNGNACQAISANGVTPGRGSVWPDRAPSPRERGHPATVAPFRTTLAVEPA
ncbi:hypothetical protein SHKM778_31860 [Streptomyces sp. KM77-8]|uniref:Uncharacterized protein n=1 Tax=Streptomyces haneummycinicus TaxID=3074435 RepID=A0AAT9HHF5_9ACTN